MAAWQYTVHVVPAPTHAFGCTRACLEEHWSVAPSHADLLNEISEILPARQHWDPDCRAWGDDDGNYIEACASSGLLVAVMVRFDLRKLDENFLLGITDFIRSRGWLFLADGGELVKGDADALRTFIVQSNAQRFVDDPVGYLEKLAKTDPRLR